MSEHDRRRRALSPREPAASSVRGRLEVDRRLSNELVDTINHHLRTPLAALLGNAELLVDQAGQLPPELHQSLGCVLRAGWRLSDVVAGICDLIDIATLDPSSVVEVDVARLIAEEVAAVQDGAERRGVQVLGASPTALACTADLRRLRRALHELLDNAVSFAAVQTSVSVTAADTPTGVRISVCDSGPGIDANDRARLTQPFVVGDPSSALTARHGMGLAIASAVAAAHRGRLVLSDSPEGGLCASLDLPTDFAQA